jgi:hypothetical protein
MTFDELVQEILEYESDTFNAPACELKKEEAIQIAETCIDWFVKNRMDGVLLGYYFDCFREQE